MVKVIDYVVDIAGKYIQIQGKTYKQMSVKNLRHIKKNNNWIMQKAA